MVKRFTSPWLCFCQEFISMKSHLSLLFLSLQFFAFAQKQQSISGYIYDANTNKPLAGVNVQLQNTPYGTGSTSSGFYSINVARGTYTLIATHVGYISQSQNVIVSNGSVQVGFRLSAVSPELDEIEIVADKKTEIAPSSNVVKLSSREIEHIPTLLGEVDIIRAIQLLPGVQSGTEGSTGFHVRGGSPDQNLILLDGVPIYNASHLFGFFSTFNSDVIENVELTKGGFPARYGGRLSSVLNIDLKKGDLNEFHGKGTISLIAPKLTLEGPIVKGKTSFLISGRRTIYDLAVAPFYKKNDRVNYFFGDANLKLKHVFSPKDKVVLSYFNSQDKFRYNYDDGSQYAMESGLKWRNHTVASKWQHIFDDELSSSLMGQYNNYRLNTYSEDDYYGDIFSLDYISLIEDIGLRYDLLYKPTSKHTVRAGMGYTYHNFKPGAVQLYQSNSQSINTDNQNLSAPIYSNDILAYAEDQWEAFSRLTINAGVHYGFYQVDDTTYNSLQPRISIIYNATDSWLFSASYSEMTQFLHLLSNSGTGMPTDLWVSATGNISPQTAKQWTIVTTKYLNQKTWELTAELYYKAMQNLIEYKEGASYISQADWQTMVETDGTGEAYGLETLLRKNKGKTTGWIAYTLAKTTRTFSNLNQGKTFPYRYDRRHNFSLVLNHKFNEQIDVSATWVYQSGIAFTGPVSRYEIPQNGIGDFDPSFTTLENLGDRNDLRYPAYHRLDVGINFTKKKKWGERIWNISIYNAYNRNNPFYIDLKETKPDKLEVIQVSLFPILPSVSYRFTF